MSFVWAFAGYGWVARDYMAPGVRTAGHRLAGVADPDPAARARAIADGFAAFADTAAMLARLRADALYVATPNHAHLPPVAEAARAGVPVLCEKPMAQDLAAAEAIAGAVTEGGILYGTAFDQRRHPAHGALAAAIRAGSIGRVTAIRIVYACWVDGCWSPAGAPATANWRADPAIAGGGAAVDLAMHGLDLSAYLLGALPGRLHAQLQRRVHDYGVEDGAMITGSFPDGALLNLHVAYNCPEALPRRRLEVVGEHGQFTAIDTMGQTAGGSLEHLCGRTGAVSVIPFDASISPFAAQAACFADAVRGGAHDFSLERDLTLTRRFDTAYRAAVATLQTDGLRHLS